MINKNKGFSLIEMIITIAILAIVTTGSLAISSRIKFADTMKAAKSVDYAMDKLRLETMSKDTKQYLYLYIIDNAIYMKVSSEAISSAAGLDSNSGKKIANQMRVSYKITSVPVVPEETLTDTNYISISFERSTGAFYSNYEYIKFVYSNSTAILNCIQETGRHWVE